MNHNYSSNTTFKIENEYDLQKKTINFIKKRYEDSIFSIGGGEFQDSDKKRIKAWHMGYLAGMADLIIHNYNIFYNGLVIEFKSPNGKGVLSVVQKNILNEFKNNNFKVICSNDYDYIIEQIIKYFKNVRYKCSYCNRKFVNNNSLFNHLTKFHKLLKE